MSHPDLHVTITGGPIKVRKGYQISGIAPRKDISLHNNQIGNLARGVLERVFYVKVDGQFVVPTTPQPGVFAARLRFQRRAVDAWMVGSNLIATQVDSYQARSHTEHLSLTEEYHTNGSADRSPWTGVEFALRSSPEKRKRNMAAAVSLHSLPIRKQDSNIMVFGKCDKTDFTAKPDAVMRVISPNKDPRYLVSSGRYVKPIESNMCHAVDNMYGEKTILKGLNANEMGQLVAEKFHRFDDPVVVMIDATRLDQHMHVQALEWEHERYVAAYPNAIDKEELSRLLSWQCSINAKGRCMDGKLRYKRKGGRTSGCINTGLGNCVTVSCMVHSFIRSLGIIKFSVGNNGDDCFVIVERRNARKLIDNIHPWFLEMGFRMKIEKVTDVLEEIDFCQTRPVCMGDGKYRMVRNVHTSVAKDSVSIKPMDSQGVAKKWFEAVGKGGKALTDGLPLLPEYYGMFERASDSIILPKTKSRRIQERRQCNRITSDPTYMGGMVWLSDRMQYQKLEVLDDVRLSFWKAFGITPDIQKSHEREMRNRTLNTKASSDPNSHLEYDDIWNANCVAPMVY
jgi:hypothetical protein